MMTTDADRTDADREAETRAGGRRLAILAAGGTGGHLFPAQALAEELVARGWLTVLMSDARARDYGRRFPATEILVVPAATITPRRPWRVPGQLWRLLRGFLLARRGILARQPAVVAGFGGYPSLPPLLAAQHVRVPTIIHEQNAVMGRANRLLARKARAIAASFPQMAGLDSALRERVVFTGNPVRRAVIEAAAKARYDPPEGAGEIFELLVFGGSQGARFFSDVVPPALAALPAAVKRALRVTQQCRPEDLQRVARAYAEAGIVAELKDFFDDMPQRMARAHLVVARAGASTVAELAVMARPAILVPLPHALDNDQLRNAEAFSRAGAGWVMPQAEITPEKLAAFITKLRFDRGRLMAAHEAAATLARPDAAARLADVVEAVAAGELPTGAEWTITGGAGAE
jgi:UDP-N-acetylglucosamine--N-acetylmuramyl-(pentapeptide) pyrophosphoryl-undecaprenol N-acetylglucosamine transferase